MSFQNKLHWGSTFFYPTSMEWSAQVESEVDVTSRGSAIYEDGNQKFIYADTEAVVISAGELRIEYIGGAMAIGDVGKSKAMWIELPEMNGTSTAANWNLPRVESQAVYTTLLSTDQDQSVNDLPRASVTFSFY